MSTVLLAPQIELPVSGKPFGDTPAMDVDSLRLRVTRKARIFVIVLVALCAVAFGIVWHVGQPFWGNWPHVNATVKSQYEYVAKGTRCTLGIDYLVNGQRLYSYITLTGQCKQAPTVGSTIILGVSPDDHKWVMAPSYPDLPIIQLIVSGMGVGFPVAGWALATVFAVHRRRQVARLGTARGTR